MNPTFDNQNGSIALPSVLLIACVIGILVTLPSCVSIDIPIGEAGAYGRVSVGYFPPAAFSLSPPDTATLGDK